MKKLFITAVAATALFFTVNSNAEAADNTVPKSIVTLEIPTENPQKSELKVGDETKKQVPLSVKTTSEKTENTVTKTETEVKTDVKKTENTVKEAASEVKTDTKKAEETVSKTESEVKSDTQKTGDSIKKTVTDVKSDMKKTGETVKETSTSVKEGAAKAVSQTKSTAKTAGSNAREVAQSAREATGSVADKTAEAAKKTIETTKNAADKTATAAKKTARNAIDGTKDFVDTVNPNKPVTKESLEAEAGIKTLKNEKKEINSAYDSRIKDVDAKIKAAENTTAVSDVQKRNMIYELNKEKNKLIREQASYNEKYNEKIEAAKQKKRGN